MTDTTTLVPRHPAGDLDGPARNAFDRIAANGGKVDAEFMDVRDDLIDAGLLSEWGTSYVIPARIWQQWLAWRASLERAHSAPVDHRILANWIAEQPGMPRLSHRVAVALVEALYQKLPELGWTPPPNQPRAAPPRPAAPHPPRTAQAGMVGNALDELGLSSGEASNLLAVEDRRLRRWRRDSSDAPPTLKMMLTILLHEPTARAALRDEYDPASPDAGPTDVSEIKRRLRWLLARYPRQAEAAEEHNRSAA